MYWRWFFLIQKQRLIALAVILSGWAVWGWFYQAKFYGLMDAGAMEIAESAKNLSQGEGLVSRVVYPVEIASGREIGVQSVKTPPLFPFLLGIVFTVFHPSERLSALFSSMFHLLLLVLVYRLGKMLFSFPVGLLAVWFCATNIALLKSSISGLPHLMVACLLLGSLLLLLLDRKTEGKLSKPFFAGVLMGCASITQFSVFAMAMPVLLWFFFTSEPEKRFSATLVFFSGMIGIVFLGFLRNWLVTGSLVASAQWQTLAFNTELAKGTSALRMNEPIVDSVFVFLWSNFFLCVLKVLNGFAVVFAKIPSLMNWAFLGAIIGGMLFGYREGDSAGTRFCLYGMAFLAVLWAACTSWSERILMPLVPFFLLLAGGAVNAAFDRFETIGAEWENREKTNGRYHWAIWLSSLGIRRRLGGAIRSEAFRLIGVAILAFIPALMNLASPSYDSQARLRWALQELNSSLPEKATVISDVPWAVAWHSEKIAIWLPATVTDETSKARGLELVDGIFLSRGILSYAPVEGVAAWQRMYLGLSYPEKFKLAQRWRGTGVLFLRE